MPEAIGLSISTIAPTLGLAFNVSLVVQSAGPAAPLAFAIGTLVMLVVGFSFLAWSRRVAHVGSAYGYITQAFGRRWGFAAGWSLLLTYLAYAAGTAAMVGNFVEAAARTCGMQAPHLWMGASAAAVVCATFLACRDTRVAGRLMLGLEGVSLLAILVLTSIILNRVHAQHALSAEPFMPSPAYRGWSGIGYALVFAVLSFGGFEAAATLGEETDDPHRNIPLAIVGSLLLSGTLFVVVSYAQVMGYGLQNAAALGRDPAPLDTLAVHYTSNWFAVVLDVAAALGSFSCVLGSLSAGGRMLYAMGRAGMQRPGDDLRLTRSRLTGATVVSGAVSLLCLLLWAPKAGPGVFYGALGTIGTLALILVYMGVAGAQTREAGKQNSLAGRVAGVAGVLLLLWPLYNSVYPVPAYPANLWPLVVLGWLICGVVLVGVWPVFARRKLTEVIQVEE